MKTTAELLLRIPLYQSFRSFGFPKLLPLNYTFLISTVCNSRCLTCNLWQSRLRRTDPDFTIEEWKKVFESLGRSPFWVTIAGGEPFLQNHLAEMVMALDQICQPAIINIPTNSLLPDRILKQTTQILSRIQNSRLVINLSLDGVGEDHDKIRGIPGNFQKVMENYQNLKKLQKKDPRLTIGFGTVVSRFNVQQTRKLFDFVFELEPDNYVTEIAEERVELGTVGLPITPTLKQYSEAIDYLLEKMKKHHFSGIGRVSRAFRFEYYQFVKDWLAGLPAGRQGKRLLSDYAGFASCEITCWGEVWPSCIKGENLGNLRKVDYDFKKIWFSKKADKTRQKIKKEGTSYPLANAFYTNALLHPLTIIRALRKLEMKGILFKNPRELL